MFELHQAFHQSNGICLWTVLALVVFAIFAVWGGVHIAKQNNRKKEFERELEEKYGVSAAERS